MAVNITFVQVDGESTVLALNVGDNLMKAATAAGVGGIVAECGGACACATCQVIVPGDWWSRIPTPGDMELSMLDEEAEGRRLSCQIEVTQDMDGLIIGVPASQN